MLTERNNIDVKVFYTWGEDVLNGKFDTSFGKIIEWDIPLLEGYKYHFTRNISKNKGADHFNGIVNPDLIKEIENWSPNAILVYGWSYEGHLKVMKNFKGKIPVWFRGDSTLIDEQNIVKRLIKFIYLRYFVFNNVDKAFYVGNNNKKYFLNYGLKASQLIFAPHAIDNQRFSENRTTEAEALRLSLGIKSDDVMILFAGKLEPKKNPLLLLQAFEKIKIQNLHLLFVGNGILEKELKLQKRLSKSGSRIHFLDFQNQQTMPVVYQSSNIFCLPSSGPGETWGLAINEAMASSKAIIVSDKVGCAKDLVKPGINGYIFKSGDINSLIESITKLLPSQNPKNNFGDASFQIIDDWSFDKQVSSIEDNLLSII